jgi:hypothetical protein
LFGYRDFCYNCSRSNNIEVLKIKYPDTWEDELQKRKKKKGNSIENFINKHGEVEGIKKYNEWLKCKGVTLENQIKKYGKIEGTKKYNEWKNSVGLSLENRIKKYGKIEGTKKYNEWRDLIKKRYSLDWFIKKYGIIKGELLYKKRCNNYKIFVTEEHWKNLYGEIEGTKRWKNFCYKNKETNTIKWYINKYGETEGKKRYNEWKQKCIVPFGMASKESMLVFFPLMDWLLEKKICKFNEIYVGINGSKEWFLNGPNFYLYDFTIKNLNTIIEYNGESFHPNPKWLTEDIDKWNNWENPFNKEKSQQVYEQNQDKINFAKEKGFSVLEIWSSDSIEYNLQKCKKFIMN